MTPIEKVTLGREHRVGPWLEEGLISLVKCHPDLSLDDLEAAVGLRTAYRIVGLRAKHGAFHSALHPTIADGGFHTTLPFARLRCKFCSGFAFKDSFGCHGCKVHIALDKEGDGYVRASKVKSTSSVVFHEIELRELFCASCCRSSIQRSIPCVSCKRTIEQTGHVMFFLDSLDALSSVGSREVRGVFADEFNELGF